jgi:TP901 family phage tail tape measure protein
VTNLVFEAFWRDHGAQRGLQGLGKQAETTHGSFAKFSAGAGKGLKVVGGAAVALGATAGVALAGAGVAAGAFAAKSVSAAGKFQSTMRQVGVSTGQSGKSLKDLTAIAIDMGAKTSFSAQGASDAMLALAKGGMSAADMKAGALQSTLTLASAGGLELGNAANYMVQGLSAFGLKAKDAGTVAAALAGAANASTGSVESMGLALSQVGAGAKTAGLSLVDTTAALAAFSNAGIQGSDAGTSLKTFLTRLVPSSKSASAAMKDLGLVTKDGKNQFFDASGKIKSMADVAGTLQKALKGQTREQKIATLTTIFGSDASRAAAVLADEGAQGLAKYAKATADKGAAEKLAKSATEGYAGALERFKGSVETAQIQVGTKMLPTLSKLLDFLSGKAMPALAHVGSELGPAFKVGGEALKTFGHLASTVLGSFADSAHKGQSVFKTFANFMATHQEDITGGLVLGAKAALGLGKGLAVGASVGLRALATLADFQGVVMTTMIKAFAGITHAAAFAFGWIPGLGPKLKKADAGFAAMADAATKSTHKVGDGLRGAADSIDRKVIPAIDKAQGSLDKIGKTEIVKARMRDSAVKAGQLISEIGTKANGSQIKLRKFSDITKLSANTQYDLRHRLSDASLALHNQVVAAQKAGVGQKALTRTWEVGRDRLYKEFRQMGLSKDEAGKLARQYAGIKPKVLTKIEQPGMKKSRGDAHDYFNKLKKLPGHIGTSATLTFKNNAGKIVANLNKSFQLVKGGPRMTFATGGVFPGYTPGRDVHKFSSPTGGDIELSGGEALMVPEFTKRMGGPKAIARMNADARQGKPIQFASGGVYRAEVNANSREGTSGSQMYGWGVKRKLEGAMSYAEKHGTVRGGGYASALAYARRHAGHPYVYGTIWDCSGFMSSLHSIIKGQSPHRMYSTPAFHGSHAQGFTRGKQSAFMVGVRPLAGRLGHMAGTLNKVNVESAGGVGVRVGHSARGYNNGMFSWRGGLHTGGMATEPGVYQLAEKGPERVLSSRQTQTYERLGRALESTGGAVTVNITVDAPNFVGSSQDLVRALTKAEQSGQLDALKRRFK